MAELTVPGIVYQFLEQGKRPAKQASPIKGFIQYCVALNRTVLIIARISCIPPLRRRRHIFDKGIKQNRNPQAYLVSQYFCIHIHYPFVMEPASIPQKSHIILAACRDASPKS